MKYAYPLGLLLGAYLLYQPDSQKEHLLFLLFLLLLSAVGFMVEYCDAPAFRAWLDRIF